MTNEIVAITLKDIYQFLVAECRYGYSRNNHLMPSGAYDHVWKFLPKIAEKDLGYAVIVAKQLCEECISDQLNAHFYFGIDDEHGNRKEAIKFVEKLIGFISVVDKDWKPYNMQDFIDNKAKDDSPMYNVYEINFPEELFETCKMGLKPLNNGKLSKNNYLDFMIKDVLGLGEAESVTYRKHKIAGTTDEAYNFDGRCLVVSREVK